MSDLCFTRVRYLAAVMRQCVATQISHSNFKVPIEKYLQEHMPRAVYVPLMRFVLGATSCPRNCAFLLCAFVRPLRNRLLILSAN